MTTEQKIKEILTDNLRQGTNKQVIHDRDIPYISAQISSLIPKWRKVEEELPPKNKKISVQWESGRIESDLHFDKELNAVVDRGGKTKTFSPDAKYWLPESELLNLIPKP